MQSTQDKIQEIHERRYIGAYRDTFKDPFDIPGTEMAGHIHTQGL